MPRSEFCSFVFLAAAAFHGSAAFVQDADPAPQATASQSDRPTAERRADAGSRNDRDRLFEQLDRDADGTITLDEVPEPLRERIRPLFERLGTDAIVRKDLDAFGEQSGPAAAAPRGPAIFRALDDDGNGRISREELSRAGEKFNELDQDGNGSITPDEIFRLPGGFVRPEPRASPSRESQPRETDRPVQPPTGRPSNSPRAENGELVDRLFQRYDEDHDGRISREEAPAKLRQHFDSFDADEDGQVDRAEFQNVASRVARERAVDRRE